MTPWRTPGRITSVRSGPTCFNAATAMTPWRTPSPPHAPGDYRQLQCGHGNDAVENCDTDVKILATAMLQCGHGNDAVENHDDVGRRTAFGEASMRPRQ